MDSVLWLDRRIRGALGAAEALARQGMRRVMAWEVRRLLRIQKWRTSRRRGAAVHVANFFASDAGLDITWLTWPLWMISMLYHAEARCWWVVAATLGLGLSVQHLVRAPKPYECTRQIRPLCTTHLHAFPCVWTLFATAVAVEFALLDGQPLAWVGALSYVAAVASSRVYAGCLGVHQVVGGLVLGAATLFVANKAFELYCKKLRPHQHWWGCAVVVLPVLFVVACMIENNAIPMGRVPRSEFMRVLGDIAHEEVTDTGRELLRYEDEDDPGAVFTSMDGPEAASDSNGNDSKVQRRRRAPQPRVDSFVGLMRTMERREAARMRRGMVEASFRPGSPTAEALRRARRMTGRRAKAAFGHGSTFGASTSASSDSEVDRGHAGHVGRARASSLVPRRPSESRMARPHRGTTKRRPSTGRPRGDDLI